MTKYHKWNNHEISIRYPVGWIWNVKLNKFVNIDDAYRFILLNRLTSNKTRFSNKTRVRLPASRRFVHNPQQLFYSFVSNSALRLFQQITLYIVKAKSWIFLKIFQYTLSLGSVKIGNSLEWASYFAIRGENSHFLLPPYLRQVTVVMQGLWRILTWSLSCFYFPIKAATRDKNNPGQEVLGSTVTSFLCLWI